MAMAEPIDDEEQQNLETYALIWLDPTTNHSPEFAQVQRQLRTTINCIQVLKNERECLDYVYSVPKEKRIILIVSGRLGQTVVPIVHDLETIVAMYVYCMNKQTYEQWAQPFTKIKRIVVQLGELVTAVREDHTVRQLNKITEPVDFTFIFPSTVTAEQTLDDGGIAFVCSYFLLECLRQTSSTATDKTELLAKCRSYYEGNEPELRTLEEFAETYLPSRALWWYTRQSFLYRLLNKALRSRNMQVLFLLQFYLHDLERQLEKHKATAPTRVFFAQVLSAEEAEQLKRSVGDYLSVSSFLSTSSQQRAEASLAHLTRSPGSQHVLFEIEADPRLEKVKPFANVAAYSYFPNDEQTLFMPGTIFRPTSIEAKDQHLWVVRLVLCSESDRVLVAIFREHFDPDKPSFGEAFCRLRRWDEAESFYERMLKGLPADHEDAVVYYDTLGNLARERGDFRGAVSWFNKSLAFRANIFDSEHLVMADTYRNLAEIYRLAKDYRRSPDSFERALHAYRKNFGNEHPMIAVCLNGLGRVLFDQKNYAEALKTFERALDMQQKLLAPTDLQLADTYKNLADTLQQLDRIDHALSCYDKSLQIYLRSDSASHLASGTVLKSIGSIHETKGQFEPARSFYQQAAASFSRVLPATDPRLVEMTRSIQRVSAQLQ